MLKTFFKAVKEWTIIIAGFLFFGYLTIYALLNEGPLGY